MSAPYDRELLALARDGRAGAGIVLREGVYVAVAGPEPGDAGRVPLAARDRRGRGGHVHRARGDRRRPRRACGVSASRSSPTCACPTRSSRRISPGSSRRRRAPSRSSRVSSPRRRAVGLMAYPSWPDAGADRLEPSSSNCGSRAVCSAAHSKRGRVGEPYVFYEGPPTANGRPGIHHVFARTIKDLICRFHAMQGQAVTRIAGWDTHGLPVEIEVEKDLKLSGKKDIERFGVAEFNRPARDQRLQVQSGTGRASSTGSATGSTTSTRTSPAATSTSRPSGGC